MDSPFVISERRDSFQIIRLNRPEKLNALTREMIATLSEIFTNINIQKDLRAVILTSTGDKAFCAGTDITELAGLGESRAREVSERGQTLCNQIESCGVPVIAAINGIAAGGGCELALACHLRIVAPNAQFSLPETKLGIVPAYGGTQRLAREIGNGRAMDMMLTGRILIQFIAQIFAVHYLRKYRTDIERPFKAWLYPVPNAIALVGWTYVFLTSGWAFISFGVLTLAAGVGAFWLWRKSAGLPAFVAVEKA